MQPQITLFVIKFILVGIIAFLAILLLSKTRHPAWMTLTGGFLFYYISIVYELLVKLDVISLEKYTVFGLPVFSLLSILIPSALFIASFIIMLTKKD